MVRYLKIGLEHLISISLIHIISAITVLQFLRTVIVIYLFNTLLITDKDYTIIAQYVPSWRSEVINYYLSIAYQYLSMGVSFRLHTSLVNARCAVNINSVCNTLLYFYKEINSE